MLANARVLTQLHIASFSTQRPENPYGVIEADTLVIEQGKIAWLGSLASLPTRFASLEPECFAGRWLTPGLIDCHTHCVYAGNRVAEFEARLNGVSYAELAAAGGGIAATVSATRNAAPEALWRLSAERAAHWIREGVTTLEIKSGYGLDLPNERKMLQVARRLGEQLPLSVRTTFLGAHALPAEYKNDRQGYLATVVEQMLPALHQAGLIDAVDAFCETIAFSPTELEALFRASVALGLPVKLHAEQLSNCHGARFAAGFSALSVDHLEYLDPADVPALARAGTVAVLLPGAFLCLGENQHPPIAALRAHAVPLAVATDANPGSSPLLSLLLACQLSCALFGLTPAEALHGVTRHAARALGLCDRGQIRCGLRADLAIWDINHPAELCYQLGTRPLFQRYYQGVLCDYANTRSAEFSRAAGDL